jgi:nucleoside-diphosphate-sugar epimerase
VKEDVFNVPITMYGCNKLYCEHLGRYFTSYFRQLGALSSAARLDFRSIRFPGLISAETVPTGGTSDFGPEMLHAAAQGQPYTCFVGPEAKIPFMAMPDAVTSLVTLLEADRTKLSSSVYNVSAFSVSAGEIADRVKKAFPGAKIDFAPDAVRSKIVDSWPEDVDDTRAKIDFAPDAVRSKIVDSWPEDVDDTLARNDWGWKPSYDFDRAFDSYLLPIIKKRYA